MILNSVQPLSLDPALTPKQADLPGDDLTLNEVFAALLWQIQSGQDQQRGADLTSANASHPAYALDAATAEKMQAAMKEIVAALQQWVDAAQENPSADGRQELEQLNTILAKMQSFFAVSLKEDRQQEIDSLDTPLPESGVPDFGGDMVANFAAVTASEMRDILAGETQQPSVLRTKVLNALQQLEKLLQQRLQALGGQPVPQGTTQQDGVIGALTQADNALNEAEAALNSRVLTGLAGDEDDVFRQAAGRFSLDEVKAQVKARLAELKVYLQNERMSLTQLTQTTQQAQTEGVDSLLQISQAQFRAGESALSGIVSHALVSAQLLVGREPVNLSMAPSAQGAMGLMQQAMEGADLSGQAQQGDDQGTLMNQGSGERGAAVGSGRLLAPITLPLRHPQWREQLAQRVMVLAQSNQNLAQIRLHPAHLGPIQIKLKMDADSGVQVSLHAHHALTREAIEQAVPRLRELFQQQGLMLGDVTVQPDEQGHAQAFAQARREQSGHSAQAATTETEQSSHDAQHQRTVIYRIDGLVDQFV
ncbi:MAG TPA: hypothetical protein EYP05_02225 [Piscirickettsiaceae bacterium]|nr:hypothetical protein [Piscirickettsiaceae bacterium]